MRLLNLPMILPKCALPRAGARACLLYCVGLPTSPSLSSAHPHPHPQILHLSFIPQSHLPVSEDDVNVMELTAMEIRNGGCSSQQQQQWGQRDLSCFGFASPLSSSSRPVLHPSILDFPHLGQVIDVGTSTVIVGRSPADSVMKVRGIHYLGWWLSIAQGL
jgi:hypothetical protein